MEQQKNSGALLLIAVVAILALVIAWFAFNRGGEDLTTVVGTEAEEVAEQAREVTATAQIEAQRAAARAEAEAELVALQVRLEADAAYEGAADELAEIQSNLAAAYDDIEGETQTYWQQTQQAFRDGVNRIQAGTADALEVVGGLLLRFENDVRPNVDSDTDSAASVEVEARANQ